MRDTFETAAGFEPIKVGDGLFTSYANGSIKMQQTDTAGAVLGHGFGLTGDDNSSIASDTRVTDTKPSSSERPVDVNHMLMLARRFDEDCNGGTGLGVYADDVKRIIKNLSPQEFEIFNQLFTSEYGTEYAENGAKWDVLKQLDSEKEEIWSTFHISDRDYDFLKNSIAQKVNEVPTQFRTAGEALLKPGVKMAIGQLNVIPMKDNREYAVYIPKNADSRAPVIVALQGADILGNDVMANETGLTQYAESMGTIVVFPTPKRREFGVVSDWGKMNGNTWNVPGYTNLPGDGTARHDDRKYLDHVLNDLRTRTRMSDKVGLLGFSDGARTAQIYAGSRGDKIAAVVSLSGTTMDGDPSFMRGMPVKIIHGLRDQVLPWNGGKGNMTEMLDSILTKGTNLDRSHPIKQIDMWYQANRCVGAPNIEKSGKFTYISYTNCKGGDILVELNRDGAHAINDKLNDGNPLVQDAIGTNPDTTLTDVRNSARWLKEHIVSRQ